MAHDLPPRPPLTRAGLVLGLRLALPILPGLVVFAAAYGAVAAQKGLTLAEATAASAFVFAGAAQVVALEVWSMPLTPAAVAGMVAVTFVVNARLILMGATLQPMLVGAPPVRTALGLFFLTDVTWLIATQDHARGGRDLGVLFACGFAQWPVWVIGTILGHLGGTLVTQPRTLGLDFIVPALFAASLAAVWRGPRPALPWLVAGLVALGVKALVPGYAFIIAGALAGAAAGALVEDGSEA